MVPEALAGAGSTGARLGPHGNRTARRAKGLGSVRRLQIPARVIEVVRRLGSAVECRSVRGPVTQYLSDARALLHTHHLPPGAAARATPLFCRLAMEAARTEVFRRRRIGRGEPHADTDEALNDARTLMSKLALALFDDAGRGEGR